MRSFNRFLASATQRIDFSRSHDDPFLWACYVTWLGESGCCADTARHYLSGIQTLFCEIGRNIRPLRMPLVKRALTGMRQEDKPKKPPKLPITVAVLSKLLSLLNPASHSDRTIWAMMALATYGLLRCGEIAQDSHDKNRFPRHRHWYLTPDSDFAHYYLPRSKADRLRDGTTIFVAANGSQTCPVAAMQMMLAKAPFPLHSTSPLFSLDGHKPITRQWFLKRTKHFLSKAGYNPDSFSGHSFRRGGAQTAFDSGLPLEEIQRIGRWKTPDVARRYFGFTVHKLRALSASMAKCHPSRPLRFETLNL